MPSGCGNILFLMLVALYHAAYINVTFGYLMKHLLQTAIDIVTAVDQEAGRQPFSTSHHHTMAVAHAVETLLEAKLLERAYSDKLSITETNDYQFLESAISCAVGDTSAKILLERVKKKIEDKVTEISGKQPPVRDRD